MRCNIPFVYGSSVWVPPPKRNAHTITMVRAGDPSTWCAQPAESHEPGFQERTSVGQESTNPVLEWECACACACV